MNKQAELSFSSTYAELNVFHEILNQARKEKSQILALLNPIEKSDKLITRLKKRFI